MKKILLAILLAQTVWTACTPPKQSRLNPVEFKTPPRSAQIHTWWHWMDGNITREGITKDLEAMKEQGIVQATILNIGLFGAEMINLEKMKNDGAINYKTGEPDFGIKQVNSLTPEWFDMFAWAVKEAHRLGITLGAQNCEGFSSSGGPWITPDMSMKQYIWGKTIINAAQGGAIKLKQPAGYYNFYKDVAVVAYQTGQSLNSFQQAAPTVTYNDTADAAAVWDGCSTSAVKIAKGDRISFSFAEPFTTEKMAIMPHKSFMWENPADKSVVCTLSASGDGKTYRTITTFTVNGVNKMAEVSFAKTRARFFRLTFDAVNHMHYYKWADMKLAECELLAASEKPLYAGTIAHMPEKSGYGKTGYSYNPGSPSVQAGTPGAVKEVVDLTSKMAPDGTLHWKPAEGNWAVIRFGYTTTGSINAPAPDAGTGLECDKMDTAALNLHYQNFPAKLIEKAGPLAGSTFKFMLIDSWEAGYQNWTAAMMTEFEKRRGYSIVPYIPVLCGESCGNAETDEAVLYDLRKTTAEMIEENYYKHFADLVHRDNMELHAEVIYGGMNWPSLDILKATRYVDMPMYEFWATADGERNFPYHPSKEAELNFAACAATCYEKPVVGAESFTSMTGYSETPAELAPVGNRAVCAGINQFILHSYILQPDDRKPGFTMREHGSNFNRNNSTWLLMGGYFGYQARIQYLMQQGSTFQDILYYAGDQLPQGTLYNDGEKTPAGHNIFGYGVNLCNYDVLKNRIKVADGKLLLNGKIAYSVLSLPPDAAMNFETLQRIAELVEAGAVVYGPRPQRMLSLTDIQKNKEAFAARTDKIWGKVDGQTVFSNNYGKGRVYWGKPLADVLKAENIRPDLATGQDDALNLMFIHKKLDNGEDVYFVMNQQNAETDCEITFRITGKTPEIWDPETGDVTRPAVYSINENGATLPVKLKPYQAQLVVFRNEKPAKYIQEIKMNGQKVFPVGNGEKVQFVPEIAVNNGEFEATATHHDGNYELTDNQGKTHRLKLAKAQEFVVSDFSGKLTFEPGYAATIAPVEIKTLGWLTDSDNPDIKYFSGTAKYGLTFKFDMTQIEKAGSVQLDLGEFASMSRVSLNGKDLGIVWKQGMNLPVNGLLKADNRLEVEVVNTYRNRFIGDFAQYGKVQTLWTTAPIEDFLHSNMPLKPAGLKGPMRVIVSEKQTIK